MCLFAILAGFFPRIAFAIYWIARPNVIQVVFNGVWIWPLLGLIFLPFTTLMYTILWSVGGLSTGDWLWVALAAVLDITHYASSAYNNRNMIPGYSGD
jgi:hypothetical protein